VAKQCETRYSEDGDNERRALKPKKPKKQAIELTHRVTTLAVSACLSGEFNVSISARQTVQNQLDAYNARDIESFMKWWSLDCQYYEFPSKLLASGSAEIRERHIVRFKEENLFGQLLSRIVVDDMVVDHETVTRSFPEGSGEVDVVAIYQVNDGKIVKAWFKTGPKRIHIPVT
jgi:hypothetical protein